MGQARTALSLTAAGSPFPGVPLTLASAQADAGPPRKNARHQRSGDGRSNALGFGPDQAACATNGAWRASSMMNPKRPA